MTAKPKLSMYWAASCGGCEVALVNLNEKILDVDSNFDFMFCPCLLDTKKKDIEALADGEIAITLFNGALRTEENLEMARLLRRKSKVLIAFGFCSQGGGIPALANLATNEAVFDASYRSCPSVDNSPGTLPLHETQVPEGTLELPRFLDRVKALAEAIDVDYFIPGCPPEPHQVWNVVQAVLSGQPLPPKGSVIGAGTSTVCRECERKRSDKSATEFKRTYEMIPDPEQCLLEQGLVCMGVVTRDGCGALCPKVNAPCTGCYGPAEDVHDQGAKMIAALGAAVNIGDLKEMGEEAIPGRIQSVVSRIPDMAGTFYRYSLAGSFLKGKLK